MILATLTPPTNDQRRAEWAAQFYSLGLHREIPEYAPESDRAGSLPPLRLPGSLQPRAASGSDTPR